MALVWREHPAGADSPAMDPVPVWRRGFRRGSRDDCARGRVEDPAANGQQMVAL